MDLASSLAEWLPLLDIYKPQRGTQTSIFGISERTHELGFKPGVTDLDDFIGNYRTVQVVFGTLDFDEIF